MARKKIIEKISEKDYQPESGYGKIREGIIKYLSVILSTGKFIPVKRLAFFGGQVVTEVTINALHLLIGYFFYRSFAFEPFFLTLYSRNASSFHITQRFNLYSSLSERKRRDGITYDF